MIDPSIKQGEARLVHGHGFQIAESQGTVALYQGTTSVVPTSFLFDDISRL
jgi:hypothetical protein